MSKKVAVGIIGSGYIAKGLVLALERCEDLAVHWVLTRSSRKDRGDFPRPSLLTNDISNLTKDCEIIVECSGDPIHAAETITEVFAHNLPVVTMDSEFHVTCGSYFADRGYLTESEGDQPGCLAALHNEAIAMGFKPLVYGNIKNFLNKNPLLEDVRLWSGKLHISEREIISTMDGTKVHFELALVANGLGATVTSDLAGMKCDTIENGAFGLVHLAKAKGRPISGFVLRANSPKGVFIVATHHPEQLAALKWYGLGDGPFYLLRRNFHLCHLEVAKTLRNVLKGDPPLLNNSKKPTVQVFAIARQPILEGQLIHSAIGDMAFRGESRIIADFPNAVPIGLLKNAIVKKQLEVGRVVAFDDVEIPKSLALEAYIAVTDTHQL